MKIGILGSGDVAKALAKGFLGRGDTVQLGTRSPEKLADFVTQSGKNATAGSFADAAAFGELLVLATKWDGTENVINLAGPKNAAGKVVIDVTNPLDFSSGAPPKLAVGYTDSAGERVQRWLPQAKVVKAFSIVGNAAMVNPKFPGGPPDMFIAGNDDGAKRTVTAICKSFGWPAIDLGGIEMARYIEPLAMIWIVYGFRTNTWNHAFKLLRT